MKISVIGTGYVGLVTGTCFSDLGHEVICMDVDAEKINKLNKGEVPIYEPGLSDLMKRNVREKRLFFTQDMKRAVQESDVIFIAVGTPSAKDGSVDLHHVEAVAKEIGEHINSYKVIVDKSTVPVGTANKVEQWIRERQNNGHPFDLVSNPEFLREGEAIKDFTNPDRIVIGTESEKAKEIMVSIYRGIERTGKPILVTDIKSAEVIKYASNAMLATRISFMNELSRVCEKMGGDIKLVAKGMGLDTRIGPRFLQAGAGYGGSCFPKDVNGLLATAKEAGLSFHILEAVHRVNEEQKLRMVEKAKELLGQVKGKRLAIWGLAFKPKTDDMREAPSIVIINELQKLGAEIVAFDPEAERTAKRIFKNLTYAKTPYEAVQDCDLLILITEWDEFRYLNFEKIKSLMKQPKVLDCRNVYDPKEMRERGFTYLSIGRA